MIRIVDGGECSERWSSDRSLGQRQRQRERERQTDRQKDRKKKGAALECKRAINIREHYDSPCIRRAA
jgi:hypothetical protein